MFYEVNLGEIIEAIHEDGAVRQVVADIVNGVNTWLFRVLSEYRIDHEQAKTQSLKFGRKITGHIRKIYEIERSYSSSRKSFREYLESESQATRYGLNYIIKSFRSSFRDNDADYTASVVALLIAARREEQAFEDYRQGLPATDLREALLSYYTMKKTLWAGLLGAGRNGGRPESEESSGKETVWDERVAFRGFTP